MGVEDSMSALMSITAAFWSGVSSHSNASSNSCCQCESGLNACPRMAPRAAGEFLNQVETLDRDEELVFAEVAEFHELLRLHAKLDSLQPDEHPDAVIDMHHEIADLQVAEVREKGAGCGPAPRVRLAFFFEDIRCGPELQR